MWRDRGNGQWPAAALDGDKIAALAMLRRFIPLSPLLLASIVVAQTPIVRWQRPEPLGAEASESGHERGGKTVAIRLLPDRLLLPLATPVSDWEVGELPDGTRVVMAGGLNEALTVHFVEPDGGTPQPFRTRAGLRLASGFAGGLGSWPLVASGVDAWMIAYREDDEIVVKALTTGSGLGSDVRTPLTVTGFAEPEFDSSRFVFTVRFEGEGAPEALEFEHPSSPKASLEVVSFASAAVEGSRDLDWRLDRGDPTERFSVPAEGGVLEFGELTVGTGAERWIRIRNAGGFPLEGALRIQPDSVFGLVRGTLPPSFDEQLVVPVGGVVDLSVRCTSVEPGEVRARLELDSAVTGAGASLELVAVVIEPAAEPEVVVATVPSVPQPAPIEEGTSRPAPMVDVARTRLRVLPPTVADVGVEWSGDRVIVSGRVRASRSVDSILLLGAPGGAEVVVRVIEGGRFRAALPIAALEPIRAAFVEPGGEASDEVRIARAPLLLRASGGGLDIAVPRDRPFLLVQLTAADDVLFSWRGRGDSRGRARVPVAFLGRSSEPLRFALLVRDPASESGVARSDVVVVEPSPGAPR